MPQLITQKELRRVGSLPFCYLCGKVFEVGDARNRDHVPPEAIFAKEDRTPPLILPTHSACNERQSADDEVIGQLVAVVHGKRPRSEDLRLRTRVYATDQFSEPMLGLLGTRLEPIIWRWVRGFHSALYSRYLPPETKHVIHPPFWRASQTDGELHVHGPLPQEAIFVELLKRNRLTRTMDRVVTCNGKCVFECTWEQSDQGRRFCLFALRLYDWERLGDRKLPQRGCMGIYSPNDGKPPEATTATRLEFSPPNTRMLDPFADA
jgi:hypothetical protein